jgi:hypothetical protein
MLLMTSFGISYYRCTWHCFSPWKWHVISSRKCWTVWSWSDNWSIRRCMLRKRPLKWTAYLSSCQESKYQRNIFWTWVMRCRSRDNWVDTGPKQLREIKIKINLLSHLFGFIACNPQYQDPILVMVLLFLVSLAFPFGFLFCTGHH